MSNNMKEKYKQIHYSLATYFLEKNTHFNIYRVTDRYLKIGY